MNEVILHEIIFSNKKRLTLSLIIQKNKIANDLKWAVSSEGRSNNPVMFFNGSELAKEEFKKRCGEGVVGGLTITSNEVFGSISGYFNSEEKHEPIKIKKEGFKIVVKGKEEAKKWKDKIINFDKKQSYAKKTLKLKG
jgi:hypothetical protein